MPTNYVGVAARRMLGSGALGPVTDRGVGVAGVTFLTVYRVAELLGAPRLAAAGRRPVSTPVLGAAVRGVLAREPGMFAAVAEHPATEQALVDAYRELSQCDDSALDRLARASRRVAEVVRVYRAARAALAGEWYDERDLMDTAAAAVGEAPRSSPTSARSCCTCPKTCRCPARRCCARSPTRAAHGRRRRHRRRARRCRHRARAHSLGVEPRVRLRVRVEPPHGTEVVSASDPDDEVRAAVRLVMAALVDGVPLERMAVLYGAAEPYARLVHEQLTAAGIPHNGAAVRTLAESVLGRSVLGLLALPTATSTVTTSWRCWRRAGLVPRARACRRHAGSASADAAGVVRGATQWHERLDRHAQTLEAKLAEELAVPDREPHPEWYEHELQAMRDLDAFVTELRDASRRGALRGSAGASCPPGPSGIVREFLAHDARRGAWPEAEQRRPTRSRRRSSGSPASTPSSPRPASTCSAAPWSSSSAPISGASADSVTAC